MFWVETSQIRKEKNRINNTNYKLQIVHKTITLKEPESTSNKALVVISLLNIYNFTHIVKGKTHFNVLSGNNNGGY